MNIGKRIRQLSFLQLLRLSAVCLQHPLYVFPTLKATKQTMKICDALYGKLHHKNNKANAFRHALWNVLICKEALKVSKDEKKAIVWAKNITNLHEKLMPNKPLETVMDLHNNKVGRSLFKENSTFSEKKQIERLQEKVKSGKQIKSISEIEDLNGNLVFIE